MVKIVVIISAEEQTEDPGEDHSKALLRLQQARHIRSSVVRLGSRLFSPGRSVIIQFRLLIVSLFRLLPNRRTLTVIGMDFGTTNTGAAWFDGTAIHPLALDPSSTSPHISRSAIYMTRSGDFYLGSAAINTYFEQNVGRPTRYRKVRVGEIIQVFAELPTFYRDVYIFEDEFSPGRLFTSIKTALRNREYYGTAFLGSWYTASDLVAIYLLGMKQQIDRQLGKPATEVVLGRPVHFSFNPEEDRIAQGRLLDAAFKAGFEKVYLEYEPVAAALSYELNLTTRQNVLVFDFGGGTLDFTIMQIGSPGARSAPGLRYSQGYVAQQVLATGGIPIAGDVFDQRLFRAVLPPNLGEGSNFLAHGTRYPIPSQIFDSLANPYEILSLNTPQNLEMLRSIHQGAVEPEKTQALLEMVSSNYALLAFDLIERAKQQLSTSYIAQFLLPGKDFTIKDQITRMRFEKTIRHETDQIRQELLATVERSGLRPQEIDRVVRTGGSSQIPLFIEMLNEIFGPDKVMAIDAFSSVTAGLAVRGRQIANGLVEATAYTPDSAARSVEEVTQDNSVRETKTANLTLIGRQLLTRQEHQGGRVSLPEYILLFLRGQHILALAAGRIAEFAHSGMTAVTLKGAFAKHLSTVDPAQLVPRDVAGGRGTSPARLRGTSHLAIFGADEHVLLVTNRQKLITAKVADLYLAAQADPRGITYVLPLEAGEWVAALTGWPGAETRDWSEGAPAGYIVMVTHPGQGRAFDMRLLAEHIGKRPYFQLERREAGSTPLRGAHPATLRGTHPATLRGTSIPAYLFSAAADSLILAATNEGRAAAAPLAELSFQPYELLRVRPRDIARGRMEERLTAAGATLPAGSPKGRAELGHGMLALGADGHWLWLEPEKLVQATSSDPSDTKNASLTGPRSGATLRRGFTPVAFLAPTQISSRVGVLGVSSQGRLLNLKNLLPVGTALQPPETPATLELHAGESLLTCLEVKI